MSAQTLPPRRHLLVVGLSSTVVAAVTPLRAAVGEFRPEDFGAIGDGRHNDTAAFAAMATAINIVGGGTIVLRRTVYRVGEQAKGRAGYHYGPMPILELAGLRGALTIMGNGAIMRCAPGLRYGTFDPATGRRVDHRMPYFDVADLAVPYQAMVSIRNCHGAVRIADLELDGASGTLLVGGRYGDTGWQIPGTGLALVGNAGPEEVVRVRSHHHALDGILVDGFDGDRVARSRFQSVRCEDNGRQGLSIVGGRGYTFSDCVFARTGRGAISSAPAAGVDVEAEAGKRVRSLAFQRCHFADNAGAGLVADNGDSAGVTCSACTFIGTTNWAAWPNRPAIRFEDCRFIGPITQAFGSADLAAACRFTRCEFRDDPALSPNGRVYGGANPDRPIADLPGNRNVLFDRCHFRLTHAAVLPWSVDVTYRDCTLSQRAARTSFPRGTYQGNNTISGPAILAGSPVRGRLILNGALIQG